MSNGTGRWKVKFSDKKGGCGVIKNPEAACNFCVKGGYPETGMRGGDVLSDLRLLVPDQWSTIGSKIFMVATL